MGLREQANRVALGGAAFRLQTQRSAATPAIVYTDPDTGTATTLASAYFSGIVTRRDGDAGLHEIDPTGSLSVLKSELTPVIGALVVRGTEKFRIASVGGSENGVEWLCDLDPAT